MIRKMLAATVATLILPALVSAAPTQPTAPAIPPSAPGVVPSLIVANISVTARTKHNEIVGSDGVISAGSTAFYSPSASFSSADAGKTIILDGLGASGADLTTTIAAVVDTHDITLANATTFAGPWYSIGRALVSNPTAVSASYSVGNTLSPTGGTYSTQGAFTITSVAVGSATVNAGGSGGANGACTVLGTTGVTRSLWQAGGSSYTAATSYFTATGTVTGGALSGALVVTHGGDYSTAPTSLTAEPVVPISGCSGLTGATVSLVMAPYYLTQTTAGHYTALPGPTNIATTTNGSGVGATISLFGKFTTGSESGATTPGDQIGGLWAYGTDDTAAINAAIATCTPVQLPAGRHLVLGAISIPWVGTSQPSMCATKIAGAGNIGVQSLNGGFVTMYSAPVSGTILDMRYAGGDSVGHVAKIDSRGFNTLTLQDITFADFGTDNYQFAQFTNTTPQIERTTWLGNATCFRMTCQQNGIAFGGYTGALGTLSSNQANAGYQGYQGRINDSVFGHLAVGVQFGSSANAIQIRNLSADSTNGTYSTTQGFYTFYGNGLGTTGDTIVGGFVEAQGYPYIVVGKSNGSSNLGASFLGGPGMFDGSNTNGSPWGARVYRRLVSSILTPTASRARLSACGLTTAAAKIWFLARGLRGICSLRTIMA